ncbi:unnamed protein product [Prunus armeniaca]|uniref:Uncharacterized protein n=1 Tax=Prunus armeniaca TaxID=36596 RepID=A0A6J5TY25_PRUAR|nr:unnamed protein product [Prunus armeniaca]
MAEVTHPQLVCMKENFVKVEPLVTTLLLGPATSHHGPSSERLPPQTSIQEGFGPNPISSVSNGTESCAGQFEPQVLEPVENAPAESSPGTESTSDIQTFTGKGHRIKEM